MTDWDVVELDAAGVPVAVLGMVPGSLALTAADAVAVFVREAPEHAGSLLAAREHLGG